MKANTLKQVFPVTLLTARELNVINDEKATVYPSVYTSGVYVCESAADCFLFAYNKPGVDNYTIIK